MIERFLAQTTFTSEEDFKEHLKFKAKEDFNFAYDVMDAWAEEAPDKLALLWTSERGEEKRFTFAQLKEQTDQAASYLQSLGIGRGDMVMLILKRHYQWWLAMLALSKIGAVAIPATHMLTAHDIVYRNNRASIKAIVCVNDDYVTAQVHASLAESPTVEVLVAVNSDTELGKAVPTDFHCWNEEWDKAPAFVRPEHVNTNDDTLLIYFTSGTSGEPKMVAFTPWATWPQVCSGTTSTQTAYTSPWQIQAGARPCGASSTASGLPAPRSSSTTTRSSLPRKS